MAINSLYYFITPPSSTSHSDDKRAHQCTLKTYAAIMTNGSQLGNSSVNGGIPKALCSLKYITVDSAIEHIKQIGQGTLLAKIDIKSDFGLLLVHPADRHFLVMRWDWHIFIDTCLFFGLRSAPKLFNVLADLLSWILE